MPRSESLGFTNGKIMTGIVIWPLTDLVVKERESVLVRAYGAREEIYWRILNLHFKQSQLLLGRFSKLSFSNRLK